MLQGRWVVSTITAVCLSCSDGEEETGAGTPGGETVVRPGDPLPEATLVPALAAMNSCFSDDGFYRTSTSLRGRQGGYSYPGVPLDCLAHVTDGCRGVARCMGIEYTGTPVEGDAICEGSKLIFDGASVNCAQISAECSEGTCVAPGQEPCDASFVSACDAEGRPTACDDVVQVGPVCADFGLVCVASPSLSSEALCVGTGEACTAGATFGLFPVDPFGTGCASDTTLTACVGGALAEIECGLLGEGFTCREAAGAFFCGLGDECDPRAFGQQCDGDMLLVCDAGRIRQADCLALGFPACAGTSSMACDGTGTL